MANYRHEPPSNNLLEFARTANAGAPKRRSAPPSQRPGPSSVAPPASVAPASVAPAMADHEAAVMLNLAAAPASAVQPVPPVTRAVPMPATSSRGGTAAVVVAGVLGLVVSLYRNDILHDLVHSSRLEPQYRALENVLGSPGFGTPRSLESIVHTAPLPGEVPAVSAGAPGVGAESPTAREPAAAPDTTEAAARPTPEPAAPRASDVAAPKRLAAASFHASAIAAKRARPPAAGTAKHGAEDSPPVKLAEESAPSAPAEHAEPKKKEAKEPTPAPSLDDAIRAAMSKH